MRDLDQPPDPWLQIGPLSAFLVKQRIETVCVSVFLHVWYYCSPCPLHASLRFSNIFLKVLQKACMQKKIFFNSTHNILNLKRIHALLQQVNKFNQPVAAKYGLRL